MKRVTGIGGVFFRAKNVDSTMEWYRKHLGIEPEPDYTGHTFKWSHRDAPELPGSTVWSLFPDDTTYFGAGQFMINYRVDDLDAVLKALEAEGIKAEGRMEEHPNGRFAWITDPEGNRIELWQPAQWE